jgi:hypothetical protein
MPRNTGRSTRAARTLTLFPRAKANGGRFGNSPHERDRQRPTGPWWRRLL